MSDIRWLVLGDLFALTVYGFRWWWDTRPVLFPGADPSDCVDG